MKESILDVLLYLFEHYFSEDADLIRDRDSLQNGLIQAGFSPTEINKAFDWLDALAAQRPSVAQARVDGPVRIYHGPELDKLDWNAAASCSTWNSTASSTPTSASWCWTARWPWTRTNWTWTT